MTHTTDGPPVIEIAKRGYVRLFSEDGDPIDLPADYALHVAEAIEGIRDQLEQTLVVDQWFNLASTALAIVRGVTLTRLPALTVDRYQYGDAPCVLDVWDEADLQAVSLAYDAPVGVEPRYSSNVDYASELTLFTWIGGVKVTCKVTDDDLGLALRDDESVPA